MTERRVVNQGLIMKEDGDAYHLPSADPTGCKHLSSSLIKKIVNFKFTKETASKSIGKVAHTMLEKTLLGEDFLIERQISKKGSKALEEQLAMLNETVGEGNYALCTETEYKKLNSWYIQGLQLRRNLANSQEVLVEPSLYVDSATIASALGGNAWVYKGYGWKAKPDLMVKNAAGQWQICDWKTTSKDDIRDIQRQIWQLGYVFSLWHYSMCARLLGYDVCNEVKLFYMPTAEGAKVIPITIDITNPALIDRMLPAFHAAADEGKSFAELESNYVRFTNGGNFQMDGKGNLYLEQQTVESTQALSDLKI